MAIFSHGRMLRTTTSESTDIREILEWARKEQVEQALIASVVSHQLFEELQKEVKFPVYNLSHNTRLPFEMDYLTPETLGLDRIALAAAAVSKYPGQDCLVIDAGTCITYDMVNRAGKFLGGAISPGVQMRFKALQHFTARLPLGGREYWKDMIGKSTHESIASGVINGTINEVSGTINQYAGRFPQLITVLTGGDAPLFDGLLKNTIFAAPDLLLEGLNHILDYHAEVL